MNYLYFATGTAPDATTSTEEVACFPADKISHFEMRNATDLRIHFTSQVEMDNDSGIDLPVVALDITSGKHKEVIKAISKAANNPLAVDGGFVVIADSANNDFVNSDITACASVAVVDAA